ncbi:MAG: hypothetical protein IPL96_15295 [Holophagaceae bacterium]|nr:hypothetical protein [Holophagaceae bacterium]
MDATAESIKSLLQQWLEDRQKSLQEVLTVTLEEELGRLRPDDGLIQRIQEQMAALQADSSAASLEKDLSDALDHLEKAPTQAEVLKALMDGLHPLSERCALFIIKQGIANLFSHRGFESDAPKSGVPVVPPPELEPLMNGTVARLSGGAAYAALLKPLSGMQAAESLMVPLRLRRKVVAVVLIDSGSRQRLDHPSLLRSVVLAAESTLSHLAAAGHEGTGAMPTMPASAATQLMPVGAPATKPVALPPSVQPQGMPQVPVPGAPPQKITAPMAPSDIRSSQPLPPLAPPPTALKPPSPAVAQALDTRDLTPSVPTQMVPDPIPMPAPPTDDLDPKIRATAERLGRVLVGDIELYFPQKVAQGRQSGNIYVLLRDELDRSRHTFVERFGPEVESKHHIFYNTVVNQLCDGDPKRLGNVPWD